jgi:hypothetical protein
MGSGTISLILAVMLVVLVVNTFYETCQQIDKVKEGVKVTQELSIKSSKPEEKIVTCH